MVNAPTATRPHGSEMRVIGEPRLLPRLHEHRGTDRMRRLGEFGVACLILAITSPLLLVVAAAIRWETPGPVLQRRERIGAGGRRFQMLTFRTTVQDPKDTLRQWAQKTTQVGQFLRQTRIDALPQLINVLRGEMSLAETFLFD